MPQMTPNQVAEFIETMSGLPLRDVAITTDMASGIPVFHAIAKFNDREKAITFPLSEHLDAIALKLRKINEDGWGPAA